MKEDKQNETPPCIDLDFKKKQKARPSTERTSSLNGSDLRSNKVHDSLSLLEKKKKYSLAIREKNLAKQPRNQKEQAKSSGNILAPKSVEPHSLHQDYLQQQNPKGNKKNDRSTVWLLGEKESARNEGVSKQGKREMKTKCRDSRQKKSKVLRLQTTEPLDTPFQSNISLISNSKNTMTPNEKMGLDLSVIRLDDFTRIDRKVVMEICPREVSQTIEPSKEDQKEVEILRKHNATFKKDLAAFRKENGVAKSQIKDLKKQLELLSERNQFLEGQNGDQLRLLQILQGRKEVSPTVPAKGSPVGEEKLRQILTDYENDLFEATSLNKKLQFRNYMLEKRLVDETELHRKQMAKEIASWKERYVRVRNENLRMKDARGQALFDISISREE